MKFCAKKGILVVMLAMISAFTWNFKPNSVNAYSEISVSAIDTIAGYSALLKVHGRSYADFEVRVEKPDKNIVTIPGTTNKNGEMDLDLYSFHTKIAGVYKISGRESGDENFGIANTFEVYPDEVSNTRSNISLSTMTLQANSYDYGQLKVILMDSYNNLIEGHEVQVISSRTEDSIKPVNGTITNKRGEVQFTVFSSTPGISYFIIQDLTANITLEQRAQIVFLSPLDNLKSIGGDFDLKIQTVSAQSVNSTVTALQFKDLPSEVAVDKPLTFTIQAIDKEKQVVNNYLSEIHFHSSDINATLPEDYLFNENDRGEHTFSVALKFVTQGSQTITVTDINNPEIKAEWKLNVTNLNLAGSGLNSNLNESSGLKIFSPSAGTTRENILTIEGQGPALTNISIYDFESLLGNSTTDSEGKFSFKTSLLPDGSHQLFAAIKDGNTVIQSSNTISLKVDTNAPTIDSVEILPDSDIATNTNFELKIFTEGNLSKASAIINNQSYPMTNDSDNSDLYIAKISSPSIPGNYPIDIALVDEIGNDTLFKNVTNIITIGSENLRSSSPTSGDLDNLRPSKVTGVEAVSDFNRVTLNWDNSFDDKGIRNYRIYYGTDNDDLNSIVNTFDNRTTWFVPNLKENTEYFFEITAIDNDFAESSERSDTLRAKTKKAGTGGDDESSLEDNLYSDQGNYKAPTENPGTGTKTNILILMTVLFTNIYILARVLMRKSK